MHCKRVGARSGEGRRIWELGEETSGKGRGGRTATLLAARTKVRREGRLGIAPRDVKPCCKGIGGGRSRRGRPRGASEAARVAMCFHDALRSPVLQAVPVRRPPQHSVLASCSTPCWVEMRSAIPLDAVSSC